MYRILLQPSISDLSSKHIFSTRIVYEPSFTLHEKNKINCGIAGSIVCSGDIWGRNVSLLECRLIDRETMQPKMNNKRPRPWPLCINLSSRWMTQNRRERDGPLKLSEQTEAKWGSELGRWRRRNPETTQYKSHNKWFTDNGISYSDASGLSHYYPHRRHGMLSFHLGTFLFDEDVNNRYGFGKAIFYWPSVKGLGNFDCM